jgi:WhiB family transcriptional regulator, redox-sensing transcriptional regulator
MSRKLLPLPIEPSPNYAPLTRDERALALCAQTDAEVWFPGKGESVRTPKRICGACEIQARCLSAALGYPDEVDGVWGGASIRQRRPHWQAVQQRLTAGDARQDAAESAA